MSLHLTNQALKANIYILSLLYLLLFWWLETQTSRLLEYFQNKHIHSNEMF